eukprot:scaffold5127_cov416-Prasinococcus_capsulatus_cf.AAC.4
MMTISAARRPAATDSRPGHGLIDAAPSIVGRAGDRGSDRMDGLNCRPSASVPRPDQVEAAPSAAASSPARLARPDRPAGHGVRAAFANMPSSAVGPGLASTPGRALGRPCPALHIRGKPPATPQLSHAPTNRTCRGTKDYISEERWLLSPRSPLAQSLALAAQQLSAARYGSNPPVSCLPCGPAPHRQLRCDLMGGNGCPWPRYCHRTGARWLLTTAKPSASAPRRVVTKAFAPWEFCTTPECWSTDGSYIGSAANIIMCNSVAWFMFASRFGFAPSQARPVGPVPGKGALTVMETDNIPVGKGFDPAGFTAADVLAAGSFGHILGAGTILGLRALEQIP